jgi:hypothetical protein
MQVVVTCIEMHTSEYQSRNLTAAGSWQSTWCWILESYSFYKENKHGNFSRVVIAVKGEQLQKVLCNASKRLEKGSELRRRVLH